MSTMLSGRSISLFIATVFLGVSSASAQGTFTPVPPGTPVIGQPGQPTPRSQQQPNAETAPGTAILRGHVFAGDTGQPLRKAQVRILAASAATGAVAGPPENRLATTDGQGAYEFKELHAGRYTLTAAKGSYVSMQYGQTRSTEPGKPIEILDAQLVERVDFRLPNGG